MYTLMNSETEIEINGKKITIKEYMGVRVVTFADIDLLHNRPEGTAKKRFYDNRKHFIEGEDFFFVKQTDFQKSEIRTFGFEVPNRGIILLTESGYLMLVKSFTDEISWQVQRQLIKGYFRAMQMQKEEIQKKEEEEDKYSNFSISSIVGGVKFLYEEKTLLEQQMKNENYKLEQQVKNENYKLKQQVKNLNKKINVLIEENREFNQICKQNQAKINFLKEDIKELKNENEKLTEAIHGIQGYLFS